MAPTDPDASYALRDPDEVRRRAALLSESHMRPLQEFRRQLHASMGPAFETPEFDPCDGGVRAEILFLLEAPGRKAVGSGYISRNNPDPTARNMNELLMEAGIPRHRSILWNAVPWYVGSGSKIRPVSSADLEAASPWLGQLIELLPDLRGIVLMGRKAQRMAPLLSTMTEVTVLEAYHPSNLSLNRFPQRRGEVLGVFERAAGLLGPPDRAT